MKTIARVLVFGALLSVGSTHALTVAYITEGPMMRNARLAKFVGPQIGGPITALPDLDKGGTHRLSVRLNSKYFSEDKSFLYIIEFDVQQRVPRSPSGIRGESFLRRPSCGKTLRNSSPARSTPGPRNEGARARPGRKPE